MPTGSRYTKPIFPYSCIVHKPDPAVEYYEAYKSIGRKYTRISQGDLADLRILAAFNALDVGRDWVNKVLFKGDFLLYRPSLGVSPVRIPNYTFLDALQANLTLAPNQDVDMIRNIDPTGGNHHIYVDGGFMDGDRANQTDWASHLIHFENVADFGVYDVDTENGSARNMHFESCSVGVIQPRKSTNPFDDCLSLSLSHDIDIIGGEYSYAGLGEAAADRCGIEIENGSYNIRVFRPYGHHNGNVGAGASINIMTDTGETSTHHIQVVNPKCISDLASAIKVRGRSAVGYTHHVEISNPNVQSCGGSGIVVDADAGSLNVEDVKIKGGWSNDNVSYGLRLNNAVRAWADEDLELTGNGLGPFLVATSQNWKIGGTKRSHLGYFMLQGNDIARTLDTVGRVYLNPLIVTERMWINTMYVAIGAVTIGNIIVGIQNDVTEGVSPLGGSILWHSASTPAGPAATCQTIAMGALYELLPGVYWACIQSDSTTLNVYGHTLAELSAATYPYTLYRYNRAYGDLTDPCPAVTSSTLLPCYVWVGYQ